MIKVYTPFFFTLLVTLGLKYFTRLFRALVTKQNKIAGSSFFEQMEIGHTR